LTLQGGLFEPPGRHFGTPWGLSGTILRGLGGFLDNLGLMLGANRSKQQTTAANSNRNQQQIAANSSNW